jgi:hypothetical protein
MRELVLASDRRTGIPCVLAAVNMQTGRGGASYRKTGYPDTIWFLAFRGPLAGANQGWGSIAYDTAPSDTNC